MIIISYARLPLQINIAQLQKEVADLLQQQWLPHYNTAHYTGNWEVLPLRSPGGSTGQAFAELMGEKEYRNTPFLEGCPYLQQVLDSIPTEKLSVRLLNLKAGAAIKPHRDVELYFEKGEARIHIPVFTNSGVEFILDEQPLQMEEGSCWYINANLTHSLQNRGLTDRVHLVIDCKVNDWMQQWMSSEQSHRVTKEMAEDNKQIDLVVAELLRQNTAAATMLAHQLQQSQ